MSEIDIKGLWEAQLELIRKALMFANWAAGEGIGPIDGESPEDFLFDYGVKADWDDDYDTLPDTVVSDLRALLDRLESAERALRPFAACTVFDGLRDVDMADCLFKAGHLRAASTHIKKYGSADHD